MLKKGIILVVAALAIGVIDSFFQLPSVGISILMGAIVIWVGWFMDRQ